MTIGKDGNSRHSGPNPDIPGGLIVLRVGGMVSKWLGDRVIFSGLERLKFKSFVKPDQEVWVTMQNLQLVRECIGLHTFEVIITDSRILNGAKIIAKAIGEVMIPKDDQAA